VGTLRNLVGMVSDERRLKSLKINDWIITSMRFMFSAIIIFLVPISLFSIVYNYRILKIDQLIALLSGLFILGLIRMALGFLINIIRAEKTDLMRKIENTPPVTADELNFDPSKYVEPEKL
jgi:hypothetical protein